MNDLILPKPIAADAETVTFRRGDWSAYMEQLERLDDSRSVRDYDAWVAKIGQAEAMRLSYTASEVARMLDGVCVVTIWRDRAGLSLRALAQLAKVGVSYLSEIETGKKPGSLAAFQRLARALNVPMDMLAER